MGDVFARLEADYCPPLDPALLSAILSDYDLNDETLIQQAQSTLDSIKASALLEDSIGFDASGTGARDGGIHDEAQSESRPGTSASQSRETDVTSVSNDISSLDLRLATAELSPNIANTEDLEALDEDTKVQLLLDVFEGKVSSYNARFTLRKCGGHWHKAMEELLNHVYFDDGAEHSDPGSKISAKSIDAFSENNVVRKGRKKKARSKALFPLHEQGSSSLPASPVDVHTPQANRWQSSAKDIEFITSRTNLSSKSVTSLYYSAGASLPRTITAVLKESMAKDGSSDDPILAVNAHDLGNEFPSISSEFAAAIVRLTYPSTAAAHEFAKALTATSTKSTGGLQLITNYKRPGIEDLNPSPQLDSIRSPTASLSAEPSSAGGASNYAARRNTALSQAYAAHRRAKSDRLMGGAAAYYGQIGREYGAMNLRATAAAADELADSQSTSAQLDLHGIDVLNAVRIAQEKVQQWWNGMGENRVNGRIGVGERQSGYRIIVGLGRHSEGGKGKLGPAVSKMLRNDGWKFEPEGAVIVVKGRLRS